MVGVAGFEPTTTCPPDKCATRLRYTPIRRHYIQTRAQRQVFFTKRSKTFAIRRIFSFPVEATFA